MQYQVIVTLGPASSECWLWEKLIEAGADAFRLNTSHTSLDQLSSWLESLASFFVKNSQSVPVVLDLQGSKWRLGQFQPTYLEPDQRITLVYAEASARTGQLPVPHRDFFQASFASGKEIILSDAKILLKVDAAYGDHIQAVVIQGGEISARKGITYVHSDFRMEMLSEKDCRILEFALTLPFVSYAVSYVKDAEEMAVYRQQIAGYRRRYGERTHIVAKLERQPAIDQAEKIAEFVDEIWLCRGDLGAELGIKVMAETAHDFTERLASISVPVMLAGQVLEHMSFHPSPTRSEVCHLYDVLNKGYAGVVLSDETATGKYPVESVFAAGMFRV